MWNIPLQASCSNKLHIFYLFLGHLAKKFLKSPNPVAFFILYNQMTWYFLPNIKNSQNMHQSEAHCKCDHQLYSSQWTFAVWPCWSSHPEVKLLLFPTSALRTCLGHGNISKSDACRSSKSSQTLSWLDLMFTQRSWKLVLHKSLHMDVYNNFIYSFPKSRSTQDVFWQCGGQTTVG